MPRLPRDVSGDDLIRRLAQFGYRVTRQTGSHVRLTRSDHEDRHVTIPKHRSLRVGTLNRILGDVAEHLEIAKADLVSRLFG